MPYPPNPIPRHIYYVTLISSGKTMTCIAKVTRSLNVPWHSYIATCPPSVKSAVYKCIVHPILEYAFPVWYLLSSGDIKQLESFQCKGAIYIVPFDNDQGIYKEGFCLIKA